MLIKTAFTLTPRYITITIIIILVSHYLLKFSHILLFCYVHSILYFHPSIRHFYFYYLNISFSVFPNITLILLWLKFPIFYMTLPHPMCLLYSFLRSLVSYTCHLQTLRSQWYLGSLPHSPPTCDSQPGSFSKARIYHSSQSTVSLNNVTLSSDYTVALSMFFCQKQVPGSSLTQGEGT